MSLDIDLMANRFISVFEINITHNLVAMAVEAGIYELLWKPGEVGVKKAQDLIEPLGKAIEEMANDPERFKKFNPPNGWGTYEIFLEQLQTLYENCVENIDADIEASR